MAGVIAAALAPALTAGASVTGGISSAVSAAGGEYSVVCGIEIENYTKWPFTSPMSSMEYGYFKKPPVEVMPGMKECWVCHKNAGTASGIFGTASWLINNYERLVVMYCCPYNFDFSVNYLAVGFTNNHNKSLTNDMYYNKETFFKRGEYYYTANPVTYRGKKLTVRGTLGTSHKPEGKISVFPNSYDDLSEVMKGRISRSEYRF